MFDNRGRQVRLAAMENAVVEKDAKSDIINIAMDELVKHSYELHAFSTLVKAADYVHASVFSIIRETRKKFASIMIGRQNN
ncbi:hypothetical protein [Neobacillus niacini]|uniref:hypothetical protein n=1 Tax=Neobacillus niacini TaxID=86668 RepID=UPI002859DC1C|nr:hypothetical protein [Neobacillus niacini]MDR6998838.1 hypothetical protein [Neobacillus niacini]